MRTSQPTQPAPRIKPEFSTPPGKLLGHGQDRTGAEAHRDVLALRRRYTPAVHCLWFICHQRKVGRTLLRMVDRLTTWVDDVNARIVGDLLGGGDEGFGHPSGLPIPKMVEMRANAELCAKVCLRLVVGHEEEAVAWLVEVCEEIHA